MIRRPATTLTILLAGAMLAGCLRAPEDEYRDAVPRSEELSVEVPGSGGEGSAGRASAPVVGERADFYQLTRDTSRGVNGTLWVTLAILHHVVSYPATEVHEDHAVWGPWTETLSPITYKLIVERVETGHYRYVLQGKPRAEGDEAFVDLLGGETEVDDEAGVKRGTIGYNIDAAHALDEGEHPYRGRIAASWDAGASPRVVEAGFEGIFNERGEGPVDALYRYRENDDGSGSFEFGMRADIANDGSLAEDVVIMTRWDASGAGRGDAIIQGGDAGGEVVYANECWDASFDRTYWVDTHDIQPNEGDSGACPYSEPLWSEMSM